MHLQFRNVNEAFLSLVHGINSREIPTKETTSRVGDVAFIEEPLTVTYQEPTERVLFNEARDCNPFFHLFESLWMLAGRNDLKPLLKYVSTFGDFSDDGETLNGAYGYRWRHGRRKISTSVMGGFWQDDIDQLKLLVNHLKENPHSRRSVLQMWNVQDDLLKISTSKDVCCNTHAYFVVQDETHLNMTVCNRSNDMILGLLGANVVHFSFLQEYLAAHLGIEVGKYHQITNNCHVYLDRWDPDKWLQGYFGMRNAHSPKLWDYDKDVLVKYPLVMDPVVFDKEVVEFIDNEDRTRNWQEPFFQFVAYPMMWAFELHKNRDYKMARAAVALILADDWRIVARNWITKRQAKWEQRSKVGV